MKSQLSLQYGAVDCEEKHHPWPMTEVIGRGKLQVQPSPQCSESDGRPEKGGLS
jgi:hypothetical protein